MRKKSLSGFALSIFISPFAFVGCDGNNASPKLTSSESSLIAGRVAIPENPESFTAWPLANYPTITYYLDGYYNSVASWQTGAEEAFKEWTAVITDKHHRTRFVRTNNPDLANIRILYASGSIRGGCTEANGIRYCDLKVPGPTAMPKAIGMVLGVPVSTTPGDVMYANSSVGIFTPSDLQRISNTFGGIAQYTVQPIFDVDYANATGSETVIGWDALRSRIQPGPYYVKSGQANRRLVGLAMTGANSGYWDWPATYPIMTYVAGRSTGYIRVLKWSFLDRDYTNLDPINGMAGGDPAPGVLGFPSCPDYNVLPEEASNSNQAAQIFAFDPSNTFLGGYPYIHKQSAKYTYGQTVPVFFFKNTSTGQFRVSNSYPTNGASCVRLGGYALAVN